MSNFIHVNFFSTTIAAAITSGDTSISLGSATGAPTIPAGSAWPLILEANGVYEVVYVTALSGSSATVARGQEGSAAQSWNSGTTIYDAFTAQSLLDYGQYQPFSTSIAALNGGYVDGAIVLMAAGNGFWLNTVAGNTNNPDATAAETSGWVPLAAYGSAAITGLTNANITLTATQAAMPIITLAGALTGNVQIIFPTWRKRWLIVNNTTGAYAVTCKTASGTGVIVQAVGYSGATDIYGDGTNLQSVDISRGSFAASFSGPYASSLAGTLNYIAMGNHVHIYSTADVYGATTSSSAIEIGGLPESLIPSFSQGKMCYPVTVSGVTPNPTYGVVALSPIAPYIELSLVTAPGGTLTSGGFPANEDCGIYKGFSFDYDLN